MTPSPRDPTAAEQRILAAVEYLAGWHPLTITTLCRALAAQSKPLAAVGCRAFVAHLDSITPEHEATVRSLAQSMVKAGLLSRRAVELREDRPA